MAVLVTGGAGYIGNHVVLDLLQARNDVIVVDDLSTGFAESLPPHVTFVRGDAGDQTLIRTLIAQFRIDEIVHLAGSIVVSESVQAPLRYYLNNTERTRCLLEAATKGGVDRFIFSSTAAVYAPSAQGPLDEEAPVAPASPYGASKMMSERMLMDAAAASGLRYGVLRYFNVAGADALRRAGQRKRVGTHLIKVAIEAALGRRPGVTIHGDDYPTRDGTGVRDYIHVSDLARAHVALLDDLRAGGESVVLNCGYGRGHSVLEVLRTVMAVSGREFAVERGPRRAGDAAEIVADSSRLKARLGWRPLHDDLPFIVQTALDWEERAERARCAA